MIYMCYCPICGKPMRDEDIYCRYCKCERKPEKSKNDIKYYYTKAEDRYGSWEMSRDILFEEEIQHNPQFDRAAYEARIQAKQKRDSEKCLDSMVKAMTEEKNKNLPKCPTCSSTNIKSVSGLKRGLHGYLFGIFSATSLAQFECKDCGYKW